MVSRTYTYSLIYDPSLSHDGNMSGDNGEGGVLKLPKRMNVAAMQQAARYLEGSFDFSAFRSIDCNEATAVKTVDEFRVEDVMMGASTSSDDEDSRQSIQITIRGSSFVKLQVRKMIATVCAVGLGDLTPRDVRHILLARNNHFSLPPVPAHGLCLVDVTYAPERFGSFAFTNNSVDTEMEEEDEEKLILMA